MLPLAITNLIGRRKYGPASQCDMRVLIVPVAVATAAAAAVVVVVIIE